MQRQHLSEPIRQRLERYPPPFDSHYGIVPPPPETAVLIDPVAEEHAAALAAIATMDRLVATLPHAFFVTRVLNRTEAVRSSRIEDTSSTLDELLSYEATQDVEETAGFRDRTADLRLVHAYATILDHLLPEVRNGGPSVLDASLIGRLHELLMRDDPEYADPPGKIRDRVVWVGGTDISMSSYNPAPPGRIAECLDDHVTFLQDDLARMSMSLPARMAVAHAHFEAIHPFRDGNGRVGRLLLPLMMVAEGHTPLYLAGHLERHKQEYYAALKTAQQRLDFLALIRLFCTAITTAADEAMRVQDELARLPAQWRGQARYRAKSAADRMLDLLPVHPMVTVEGVARLLDISFVAANRGVEQLVERGVLRERTGYRRNRIFVADAAITAMTTAFVEEI